MLEKTLCENLLETIRTDQRKREDLERVKQEEAEGRKRLRKTLQETLIEIANDDEIRLVLRAGEISFYGYRSEEPWFKDNTYWVGPMYSGDVIQIFQYKSVEPRLSVTDQLVLVSDGLGVIRKTITNLQHENRYIIVPAGDNAEIEEIDLEIRDEMVEHLIRHQFTREKIISEYEKAVRNFVETLRKSLSLG